MVRTYKRKPKHFTTHVPAVLDIPEGWALRTPDTRRWHRSKKCCLKGCSNKKYGRGLCKKHHAVSTRLVQQGRATWEALEVQKQALPILYRKPKSKLCKHPNCKVRPKGHTRCARHRKPLAMMVGVRRADLIRAGLSLKNL